MTQVRALIISDPLRVTLHTHTLKGVDGGAGSLCYGKGLVVTGQAVLVVDVMTPLGFRVTCTAEYWQRITTIKHPPMSGRLDDVIRTLSDPDEVRRSVGDPDVMLFHRRSVPRWVCAVVKKADGMGYLITAYPADKIKSGEVLWTK